MALQAVNTNAQTQATECWTF